MMLVQLYLGHIMSKQHRVKNQIKLMQNYCKFNFTHACKDHSLYIKLLHELY